jgi:exodeoxyribonuclease VII large subunit
VSRRRSVSARIDASPSLFEAAPAAPDVSSAEVAAADLYEEVGQTFPGASPGSAIAVSTLTQIAKDVVEGAFIPLWVRGEVSDFKRHRNGHWYFCLRDLASQLRCVVWSRDQRGILAAPDDGMQVMALGQIGVYAARGEMQFTVRRMEADGDGLWRKALELTRQRLDADGLLAPERKRSLPRSPRRIAFVTSASGAALRDVMAVLRRRAPGVELVVVHASVQGESAPLELCAALDQVARWNGAELVIIGRGGGSREDLWAFNDERVARALAACPVPTISAVGHEVDVTLCDLVADLRAPTPSAAAEAAVISQDELLLTHRAIAHAVRPRRSRRRCRDGSASDRQRWRRVRAD